MAAKGVVSEEGSETKAKPKSLTKNERLQSKDLQSYEATEYTECEHLCGTESC